MKQTLGFFVIPAQAGIQQEKYAAKQKKPCCPATRGFFNQLDSGLRRNDGLLMVRP
jgi:hypothetical protein